MSGAPFEDVLNRGAATLREAGIETARSEAKQLLLAAADMDATALISHAQAPCPADVQRRVADWLARRAAREPMQHILGKADFYGLDLKCDARALIPRPDSEAVVDAALTRLPSDATGDIADLGTGSGCLLLAILSQRTRLSGAGIDASPEAAGLARQNVLRTGLQDRAEIVDASWAHWAGWGDCRLIVSNPPYIAAAEINQLAPEVRRHDPLTALDGGEDGLDCYRELAALGARRMADGASLILEIGHDQGRSVPALLGAAGFSDIAVTQDLGGRDRVVSARKS